MEEYKKQNFGPVQVSTVQVRHLKRCEHKKKMECLQMNHICTFLLLPTGIYYTCLSDIIYICFYHLKVRLILWYYLNYCLLFVVVCPPSIR